ncbi:hypothetical protein DP038_04860 [Escherichia coli]|nr:hypothetical protein [Escherichia coli O19]EFO2246920.1 hypothetical protein [Escherichia coli]
MVLFAWVVGEVSEWKRSEYFQDAMSTFYLSIFGVGGRGGMLKEKLSFPDGKLLRLKVAI